MTTRDPNARWKNELLRTPRMQPDVTTVHTADGARLNVHAYGPKNAEPIVLSHGWTCSIAYWNPQINALAGKYRVIAYDQRGHGASDLGRIKLTSDVLADDLAAVLAATVSRRKKAVIVGHSMGGMSIMAWAAKFPHQVEQFASAVVLANTGADRLIAETTVVPLRGPIKQIPGLLGQVVLGAQVPLPTSFITRRPMRWVGLSPSATAEEVDFCWRLVSACKGRTRGRWGVALSGLDIATALDKITVPTTVIAGERDRLTPPIHSERLAGQLAQTGSLEQLLVLPGAGHMGNIEAPHAFNDEVVRLRTLSKRRARRRNLAVAAAG